jgi:DNA invertase Pin-like site-specific DNA recombinase
MWQGVIQMPKQEARNIAIHEAGHAVIGRMLTLKCGSVSIAENGKGRFQMVSTSHLIYTSTSKQDTDKQRRELKAVTERSGWQIVKIYEDAGISGAKGREKRPELNAMMKAVNAKEFAMVASWSVDRLGRSLTDLLSILQTLHEKGVGLFLHQQGLDTSTTAGKAMFQMLGVFAEFERGIIRERVNAGLARARAKGTKLGRRRVNPSVEAQILELRANGDGMLKIGRKLGIGTSVVQRVFKQEPLPRRVRQ